VRHRAAITEFRQMNRFALPVAGLLLLAPLSMPLFAQVPTPAPAATHAPAGTQDGSRAADGHSRHARHHRHGVERMDADHDGRVSRDEFAAAQAARASRHRMQDDGGTHHRTPDFAAMDRDHDGYVVASEVRAYRERMRPQRDAERKARFDTRFSSADLNRDGKLGRVEVSEHLPKLTSHFAWLDENRDGFLSRAELQAGHERR
jgi:Ca2+-binding EF-hand superfamily protein